MAEKRKDKKGRVLKDGESFRADGRYMYRYTDLRGNRKYIYAHDLNELREKEQVILRAIQDSMDYAAREITVLALVERYIPQREGVGYNTQVGYNFVLDLHK